MATFSRDIAVHFSDTDPAGIVFYPRYFEMTSGLIEDWFADALDHPFNALHHGMEHGVPTISLDISFSAASRIADILCLTLAVERLGKSSFTLDIRATCGDEERFRMRQVLVHAALGGEVKPAPLPDDLRARMEPFLMTGPAKDE
ncbi:MAG: acyl-CoA thioesterase [Rhodospirillaceae bacterium]|jgi:4-hydroxybenzoyl-CoA thioesterase|nr:acyl-CoA thioesterase [Rhodospirillaceae bacterium]